MVKVLIADEVAPQCLEVLTKNGLAYECHLKPDEAKFVQLIPAYDAVIVRSSVKVTRPVIEAGKNLKIIGRAGVGVDNVDVPAATERGIPVINSPSGNTTSAAEHTFGLILACARNIAAGSMSLLKGEWKRSKFVGFELEGKRLGIVGLGRIGSKIAGYARAFGMDVVAYDPYVTAEQAARNGVKMTSVDEILKTADVITVHVALTNETKNMIDEKQLRMMKKTAVIVNVARGGIINETALANAVREGVIAGAAIDVFTVEPPPKDHPLLSVERILVTPHLGASTHDASVRVAVDVAEKFVDFFKSGAVRDAVNADAIRKR